MQQIVQQLGGFFLDAVPTMILFIILVVAYEFLVQKPLNETLKQRRARTVGAIEDAQKAIALAETRSQEYADKLRQARSEVYKARERRVKQWTADRDAALDQARKSAGQKVLEARAALQADAAEARKSIENAAAELASQVVRAVLPAAAGSSR